MQNEIVFTEKSLDSLREQVCPHMSPKRYHHTMGVEREAAKLAALYCPEQVSMLRAAALLHDLTKEETSDFHARVLRSHGEPVTAQDFLAPKTFHARSAVCLIPEDFSAYADPALLSAIRFHTTGRAGMTVTEMMLYLADYIEDTRTFPDCVTLRQAFWGADPEKMTPDARLTHLYKIMVLSFDMTIRDLLEGGHPISDDTFHARNDLLIRLQEKGE